MSRGLRVAAFFVQSQNRYSPCELKLELNFKIFCTFAKFETIWRT